MSNQTQSAVRVQDLARQVQEKLEQLADPERKEWAKTSFPTAMKVIGVRVPDLRPVDKELSSQLRKAPADEVIALAKALVASGFFECRQIGYGIISRHQGALAALQLADLEVLGQGIDNWASVDGFAALLAGPAWRQGQVSDEVIREWAHSEDRWWRRAAVVCTVALNQKARGGTGDPERTLDVCRLVAADQDEMVSKALSWALRELAKRDPTPVVAFMEEYEQVLPPRVKREVRRKLETGRKY